MENETCPICTRIMEDSRHVGVECFYDVLEVAPKAVKSVDDKSPPIKDTMYKSVCCKSCHADFLEMLGKWAHGDFISTNGLYRRMD